MKLKGKVYNTVVRPDLLYGAETWATTRGQVARLEVNEMRMLRWIGLRSEMNILEGQQDWCNLSVQENHRKTTEVVRPCEENVMWTYRGKEEEDGQTYDGKMHARET